MSVVTLKKEKGYRQEQGMAAKEVIRMPLGGEQGARKPIITLSTWTASVIFGVDIIKHNQFPKS